LEDFELPKSKPRKMTTPENCPICLDPLVRGKAMLTLDCGHALHLGCFKEARRKVGGRFTCPLCRHLSPPSQLPSTGAPSDGAALWAPSAAPLVFGFAPPSYVARASYVPPPRPRTAAAHWDGTADDEPLPAPGVAPEVAPPGEIHFSLVPEYPLVGAAATDFLAVARLEAPKAPPAAASGSFIDLVFVVDTSGSMAGEKLGVVQATLKFVVSQLRPNDRICIVHFSETAGRMTPLRCGGAGNRPALDAAIDGLVADGGTNIFAGIGIAFRVLRARRQRNVVSCVALLTDGQDGNGQLLEETREALRGLSDVSLYSFGFGPDHKASLLTQLAEAGHGSFRFIANAGEVPGAFGNFLGGVTSVYAQRLEIRLAAGDGATIAEVATAYPTKRESDRIAVVSISDLFHEERRAIPVAMRLAATAATAAPGAAAVAVLSAQASLSVAATSVRESHIALLSVRRLAGEAPPQARDPFVEEQVNRLTTAKALKEAERHADAGDLERARRVLDEARAQIERSPAAPTPAAQQLLADIARAREGVRDVERYTRGGGSQYIAQQGRSHAMQRAVAGDSLYSVASQAQMEMRSYAQLGGCSDNP
jgi:uncharacterized protein YegL